MVFFRRIARGAKKVVEYKKKLEDYQDRKTEERAIRAEKYRKQYKAQAAMYREAARRDEARRKLSNARMGSFGQPQEKRKKKKGIYGLDYL